MRFVFTQDLPFAHKGRTIIELPDGDFRAELTAAELAAGLETSDLVLRRAYVRALAVSEKVVPAPLDSIFDTLSRDTLDFVEDQLGNNESCDDDELAAHFVANGISPDQAARAITYRNAYQLGMFRRGDGPIYGGLDIRPTLPRG